MRNGRSVMWVLIGASLACGAPYGAAEADDHRQISGVYPHTTTYAHNDPQGLYKTGSECGIGAVVPWAGKLWLINYAAHMPNGSDHKLYSIDADMNFTVHPESVGGTPAARMIHRESNQLLIGPYLIDAEGKVRVISPKIMPGRITAIARHLKDPANMVYYYMMEGELWEANVRTLEVHKLFNNPLPGWHGKGGYTSQGRLVVSNNGERGGENTKEWQVTDLTYPPGDPKAGALASWDGEKWTLIERHQFTDVTGPGGIHGAPDDNAPLWTIGWDKRSLKLKLLQDGAWHDYRLPKAAFNNDPSHGWFTEWPRIRELSDDMAMMDMHGMFFDFPRSFALGHTAGIRPIGSHLRYIPDFCVWNDRLVLATDETSVQGNELGGQPQSNLWFGTKDDLRSWGPRSAYGGPWVNDPVKAGVPSDPFHIAGYPRRVLHIVHGVRAAAEPSRAAGGRTRTTDKYPLTALPDTLAALPMVATSRGLYTQPGRGFGFTIDKPATVYLLVDARAVPEMTGWTKTDITATWDGKYHDAVYKRDFPAGEVAIGENNAHVTDSDFGMPHTAFVSGDGVSITAGKGAKLIEASAKPQAAAEPAPRGGEVTITLELDRKGDGLWEKYKTITAPANALTSVILPDDLDAEWVRLTTDRDVDNMTAYFHYTDDTYRDPAAGEALFAGLADISYSGAVHTALVRPSSKTYDLNLIARDVEGGVAGDEAYIDLNRSFEFKTGEADAKLKAMLTKQPLKFRIDNASVIVTHNGVDYRLPKGDAAYDKFGESTFVRVVREVESERELANIHGTFYELPLAIVGQPPLIDKLRPVASHHKAIYEYMTWRGLLLLSGVRADATEGGHILLAQDGRTALWAGAIDDLWKLGKPVGHGGPWRDTAVKANTPSDPYLMTGYDRKTLTLTADKDTTITLEVDIDHQTGFHAYNTFEVKAGTPLTYTFPVGFSAHWARLSADTTCTATAEFVYE